MMTTAILYYSFGGYTRLTAQKLAADCAADLIELQPEKHYNLFTTFLRGCPAARQQKGVALRPLTADLHDYTRFILAAPVWAGYPAPPFNSALALLPANSTLEVVLTSGSGKSARQQTIAFIEAAGHRVLNYQDIRAEK